MFEDGVCDGPSFSALSDDLTSGNAGVGEEDFIEEGFSGHGFEWAYVESTGIHGEEEDTNVLEALFSPARDYILRRIVEPALERAQISWNDENIHFHGVLLRAHVALYEQQHGTSPESLSDVMNGKDIPINAVTGNAFQYSKGKIFSPGPRRESVEATADSLLDGKTVF